MFTVFALCGCIFQNEHPDEDIRVLEGSNGELM